MKDHLTTAEAAQVLGKTPSAISRAVSRGELKPSLKLPGKRGAFLFDPKDIEDYKRGAA